MEPLLFLEMNLSNNNHLPPKVEKSGNVKIITFTGDEVRDVENVLAKELKGHMEDLGECHLLLDFTNVEYLSSVELGTLITLHKRVKASKFSRFSRSLAYKRSWGFAEKKYRQK